MEKYGSTEITQKKSGEMGQAKEAVFASLPRSGLLEPVLCSVIRKIPSRAYPIGGM
jgi:hypothetical protein